VGLWACGLLARSEGSAHVLDIPLDCRGWHCISLPGIAAPCLASAFHRSVTCACLPPLAPAEGGTAIIYDWDRNTLEAIFNVPPNW